MVAVRVLASEIAFLDEFLRVVPGSAGVGHEHCEHEAGAEASDEKAEHSGHAEHYSDDYRGGYRKEGRAEHLVLGGLGRDFDATLVVGSSFSGQDALDLTELAAHFDDHL